MSDRGFAKLFVDVGAEARKVGRAKALNEVMDILLRHARAGNDFEKVLIGDIARDVVALDPELHRSLEPSSQEPSR